MRHCIGHSLAILLLTLGLAGCDPGRETPDLPPESSPQPAPETNAEDTAETPEPAPDDAAAADKPEIVEESAAVAPEQDAEERAIVLAKTEAAGTVNDWKFSEGRHFTRLVPTQPTVGGADKIEVAEFFWYGCGHCLEFEPYINRWAENKPANTRFVRIPALWNPLVKLHGQLYYTEEVLSRNGKIDDPEAFRAAVFNEYHRRGNRLTSVSAIQSLFERFGVSAQDFESTWKSFEVDQKLRVAEDLARRYAISGVPTVVVNGKYRTGAGEAGGFAPLIEVINELVARESAR